MCYRRTSFANIQISDDCSSVDQTVTDSSPVSCTDGRYYIIRTWTATDDCGIQPGFTNNTCKSWLFRSGYINNIPLFQTVDSNDNVIVESVEGYLYGISGN